MHYPKLVLAAADIIKVQKSVVPTPQSLVSPPSPELLLYITGYEFIFYSLVSTCCVAVCSSMFGTQDCKHSSVFVVCVTS
ncbi:hypothetical protein CBS63078_8612 [Aspergillus niger]|nr:hypothetical protein CBS115989_4080 [Aspergillus niger]KAI2828538.1 hypothetical protein CBS133816_5368 [Aspergillus niger]KAI2843036.1 hypothetical protein CBS11232_8396 [Aspergillus niger]KAI2849510.1 hypothetical protein CBS11350_2052 [Aspergillus niger]KAI2854132.1 hypothetical protein CBS12448_7813 [Aspergillus niger]